MFNQLPGSVKYIMPKMPSWSTVCMNHFYESYFLYLKYQYSTLKGIDY